MAYVKASGAMGSREILATQPDLPSQKKIPRFDRQPVPPNAKSASDQVLAATQSVPPVCNA